MARRELDLKNAPWRDRKPDNQLYGYYISFDATGCEPVDEVLRAVASAAKNYHSTEYWRDADPESHSPLDWIQCAAQSAADEIATLRERVAVLESSLREMAEKLEIGMDVNPSSSCDIFATLLYMHGLWMGRDLAAAKPAAQEGKEAADG